MKKIILTTVTLALLFSCATNNKNKSEEKNAPKSEPITEQTTTPPPPPAPETIEVVEEDENIMFFSVQESVEYDQVEYKRADYRTLAVNGYLHKPSPNTEEYAKIVENNYKEVLKNPLSTFSVDVDGASYSNTRRFITQGSLPPEGAVRVEEFINYFSYDYPQPKGNDPFSIYTEVGECPWNPNNKLVHIGLQGKSIAKEDMGNSNLVFLLDVSGSMDDPDKLPLLKSSFSLLADELGEKDRIAIVVYAGAAGVVLPSTSCNNKTAILDALQKLEAGGSTAGGEGIQLAYKIAQDNFIKGGNNRIILATDGDFNVGASSDAALVKLIEEKRQSGVFLSVLGFGTGNYKDFKMEQLADAGNGNFNYIDNLFEAKKVLVNEMGGTLLTIAKDVKIQIEFNPAKVAQYRLIGYENRLLNNEDFEDDKKDAGEIGAGHTVTALYEIIPVTKNSQSAGTDYKYQSTTVSADAYKSNEIANVKFRYKKPDGDVSKLLEQPIVDKNTALKNTSDDYRFSAAVAEFAMLLRQSEFKGNATYEQVLELAKAAKGKDEKGYRAQFIDMAGLAKSLDRRSDKASAEK